MQFEAFSSILDLSPFYNLNTKKLKIYRLYSYKTLHAAKRTDPVELKKD